MVTVLDFAVVFSVVSLSLVVLSSVGSPAPCTSSCEAIVIIAVEREDRAVVLVPATTAATVLNDNFADGSCLCVWSQVLVVEETASPGKRSNDQK